MIRILTASLIALSFSPLARAQDMPLAQILIDGEGWKKGEGKPPDSTFSVKINKSNGFQTSPQATYTINARTFRSSQKQIAPGTAESTPPGRKPQGLGTAAAISRDGGTVFIGYGSGDLWAYPVQPGGELKDGEPYCPIRVDAVRWKGNPDAKPMPVTAMTGDKDGRIYAATALGVQVFDPTGRLCGVLTPAAPGKAEHLAFEGDKLVLWIGEQKYERKLRTSGVGSR